MCLMGGITYLFMWVLAGELPMERCVYSERKTSALLQSSWVCVCARVWVCDGVCLCEVRELTYMGTVGLFVIIYVWAVVGGPWLVQ